MSESQFDRYVSRGNQQGSAPSGSGQFDRWVTGGNQQSTQSNWNTPFYREFFDGYRTAQLDGTASNYFLNRRTGIAGFDHEGVDDQGARQSVRAGDVFAEGRRIGNLYDQYGQAQADLVMARAGYVDPQVLSRTRSPEELRRVVQTTQEDLKANYNARATREAYDRDVEELKEEWGDDLDFWSPTAGAAGGAVVGAGIGTFIAPGLGTAIGAGAGALVGGLGAWLNRDEMEEIAVRAEVQARQAEQRNPGAAFSKRLEAWSGYAGQAMNPLGNLVHGLADDPWLGWGVGGDNKVSYYDTDEQGRPARNVLWSAADLVGTGIGAAGQFATGVGAATFSAQMTGQIAGKAGSMILTGGETFDERTGTFDNVFFNRAGEFDALSGAAGIAEVGIDAVQLFAGRGLMRGAAGMGRAPGALGKATGAASLGGAEVVGGTRFLRDAAGNVTAARLHWSAVAPSELVQHLGARLSATLARRGGLAGAEDIYEAALRMQRNAKLWPGMLVNGFGEMTEEWAQAVLEPLSHNDTVDAYDAAWSAAMGFATGAGMTAGSRVGTRTVEQRNRAQAASLYNMQTGREMPAGWWEAKSEKEKRTFLAAPKIALETARQSAEQLVAEGKRTLVRSVPALEARVDAGNVLRAQALLHANSALDFSSVITKAESDYEDYQLVGSLNQIARAFEMKAARLREMKDMPEVLANAELAKDVVDLERLTTKLSNDIAAVQKVVYNPKNSDAKRNVVVAKLNQTLRDAWEVADPTNNDDTLMARAVALMDVRNPNDNPGSFQLMQPQVSIESTMPREKGSTDGLGDGVWQMTLGPTEAQGADFDGDKITALTSVLLDRTQWANLRMGSNLLGMMGARTDDAKPVMIMKREFEEARIEVLAESLKDTNAAVRDAAEDTIDDIQDALEGRYGSFAQDLIETFIQQLEAGNTSAKDWFLQEMYAEYFPQVQEVAQRHLTNEWFWINSMVQRMLQRDGRKLAHAVRFKTAAGVESTNVTSIPAETKPGRVLAARAATWIQTLFNSLPGAQVFRNIQTLNYNENRSPDLERPNNVTEAIQVLTRIYQRASSGLVEPKLDSLRAKDRTTGRVAAMMVELLESDLGEVPGVKRALLVMARMEVPDLGPEGQVLGRSTLVQELLKRSVRAERALHRGVATVEQEAQWKVLENASFTEAMREVFGAYTMVELAGDDGYRLGGTITLDQAVARFANQDTFHKRLDTETWRSHATYLRRSEEAGKHDGPLKVSDLTADVPYTPFQVLTDLIEKEGNSLVSWNTKAKDGAERAGGRVGRKSVITSTGIVEGLEQMQRAVSTLRVSETGDDGKTVVRTRPFRSKSLEAWRELLQNNPDYERALFDLLPAEAKMVLLTPGKDGQSVYVPDWVYGLLTMPPKKAEWVLLRQSFLAARAALGPMTDKKGQPLEELPSHVTDRLMLLAFRLASDPNPLPMARFTEAMANAETADDFFQVVNTEFRGNEAAYTPWARDLGEVDPSASFGSLTANLPSAEHRTKVSEFRAKADRFAKSLNEAEAREEAGRVALAQLQKALLDPGEPDSANSRLIKRVNDRIQLVREFQAPLGPDGIIRMATTLLHSLSGWQADKGKSQRGTAHYGAFGMADAGQTFGTMEEIQIDRLTAVDARDVVRNAQHLVDGMTLMDDDGAVVDWNGVDAAAIARYGRDPNNHALLYSIVVPSVYEHVGDDRVSRRFLQDPNLASLVHDDMMNSMLVGESVHNKMLHLSFLEGAAGGEAVTRYLTTALIAGTSSRWGTIELDQANERALRAAPDLVDIVKYAALLAEQPATRDTPLLNETTGREIPNPTVLDEFREGLKAQRKQAALVDRFGSETLVAEQAALLKITRKEARDMAAEAGATEAAVDAANLMIDAAEAQFDTGLLATVMNTYRLPEETEGVDWMEASEEKRRLLYSQAMQTGSLLSEAQWSKTVRKLWMDPDKGVDGLPILSKDEWEELSRVLVLRELSLRTTTAGPGLAMSEPPSLDSTVMRYYDPSFNWVLDDLLSPDSPLIQAELKLQKHNSGFPAITERQLAWKIDNSFLSTKAFGTWTDSVAVQVREALSRVDSSAAQQMIGAGGSIPKNGDALISATRRNSTDVPDDALASTVRLSYAELLNADLDATIPVQRPGGRVVDMPLALLDGRFARTAEVDGQNVLTPAPMQGSAAGYLFTGDTDALNSGLRITNRDRLRRAVESLAARTGTDAADLTVEVSFFHPDDQPLGMANSLYFEGVALEGDVMAPSLLSGWWLLAGGVDADSSASALQAVKRAQRALRSGHLISKAESQEAEAGWQADYAGMLRRKAWLLLGPNRQGEGERINAGFLNSIVKTLKMRHLVRGKNAEGKWVLLSSEQVIAAQQAGKDLQSLGLEPGTEELVKLSARAVRTMVGERGEQGLPRATKEALSMRRDTWVQWAGEFTPEHTAALPGLLRNGKDLFETSAKAVGDLQTVSRAVGLDRKTLELSTQAMQSRLQKASEIHEMRRQAETPDKFRGAALRAVEPVGQRRSSVDLSLVDARIPTRGLSRTLDELFSELAHRRLTMLAHETETTGWVYHHTVDPTRGRELGFGHLHGRDALSNKGKDTADSKAPGDILRIVLDEFIDTPADLPSVLERAMHLGMRVVLDGDRSDVFTIGEQWLREHGYTPMDNSPHIYELDNPHRLTANVRSRQGQMVATRTLDPASVFVGFQTGDHGIEENHGYLVDTTFGQRVMFGQNLVPLTRMGSFLQVDPHEMDRLRPRIQQGLDEYKAATRAMIKESKTKYTKRQTDKMLQQLEAAIQKTSLLLDDGTYPPGTELLRGDILPLYNAAEDTLLLYRHGHKAPTPKQQQDMRDRYRGNIIYSPELNSAVTAWEGKVIRFVPTRGAGMRVELEVPLSAIGDKLQFSMSGFKLIVSALPQRWRMKLPKLQEAVEINALYGTSDSDGKTNYYGRVDNFATAFAYLGIDFRSEVAKTLFGDKYTPEHDAQAERLLREFSERVPKLRFEAVDALMKMENLDEAVARAWAELQRDGERWADTLSAAALTPAQRVTRAILTYLMYEGADVSHVLSSAGLSEARMQSGTALMREMPTLFTQVFEKGATDELRLYAIKKLNDRLPNLGSVTEASGKVRKLGYWMGNDFRIHASLDDAYNNFSGWLQFTEVTSSGANPVVDLAASDRTDSQKLSESQSTLAYATMGAITPTAEDLEKVSRQFTGEAFSSYETVDDLFSMLHDAPARQAVEGGYLYNRGQRESMLSDRLASAGYKAALDKSDWTESQVTEFEQRRDAQAQRSTGSTSDAPMVEQWIRQHAGRPAEKDSKVGYISFDESMQYLDRIEKNRTDLVSPVFQAAVPMLSHPHLRRLHEAGLYEMSSRLGSRQHIVTSWEDWAMSALGMGKASQEWMDPMYLPATDGFFQTYANAGIRFTGLPLSIDPFRSEQLADPSNAELLVSISPHKRSMLSEPEVLAIQGTLEELYGGTRVGLQFNHVLPPASAEAKRQARIWGWRRENKIGTPTTNSYRDFLRYGAQFVNDGNRQAAPLRIATNMRAFLALANPLLYVGAPIEMAVLEVLEQASAILLGTQSRGVGAFLSGRSEQERAMTNRVDAALGRNQKFKGMVYSEVALDPNLYNAGALEVFTSRGARMAGKWQDPYYGTTTRAISKRYREAATNFILGDPGLSNITEMDVVQNLAHNPYWLRDNHPGAHQAGIQAIKAVRNVKATPLSLAFRGLAEPLSNSPRVTVAWPATILLRLQHMFAGYAFSKMEQVMGLQGVNAAWAAILHGKEKGAVGRSIDVLIRAVAGEHRDQTDANARWDFSEVLTQVDVTQEFVKAGLTHAGLMAAGLMAGGLGLSGEDDEDRKRRLAARNQGFAYLYDPREIQNDFRNASAVYLDNVPLLSEVFAVTDETGRTRSMAHMNWIIKQVVSPIIGMERFFNNGNPMEILWGFEDAIGSMPLVNTMRWDEAAGAYAELMEAAEREGRAGSPESLPKVFRYAVSAVSTLERMLLESSFINSLYVGLDKYDRDPWVKPDIDHIGRQLVDGQGNPQRTTMLRDYVDEETGETRSAYVGRDWYDAQIHTLTENRFTAAMLAQAFVFVTGGGEGNFVRTNMPVKTRTIPKEEIEVAEAEAHIRAIWKGGLDPAVLGINPENFYMSFETRSALTTKLQNELINEFRAAGLSESKAKQAMYRVWQGDPLHPESPGLEKIVWSKGPFENWVGSERSTKYNQLNTTYIMGPDGKPWATGISRNLVSTWGGFAPVQGYHTGTIGGMNTDGLLNMVDERREINTGMRALERIDSSFDNNIAREFDDKDATGAAGKSFDNGWVNYDSGGRNFGRRSGWRSFGSRGGGGGGGSSIRINTPERQQVPYANDIQNINMTNPIIRRASIRRERIDSQKGRLKPWQ